MYFIAGNGIQLRLKYVYSMWGRNGRAQYSTKSATPTRQSVNTANKTNDASLRESKPVC